MKTTADVTGGKPIAVLLQSISGVSAINPLVAFYDIHGAKERRYSFILSRTPHETIIFYYSESLHTEVYQLILQPFFAYLFQIPRNTRLLYLHAYQSLIWNQCVSERVKRFGLTPAVGDIVPLGIVDKEGIYLFIYSCQTGKRLAVAEYRAK
jgi:hypothetical protein